MPQAAALPLFRVTVVTTPNFDEDDPIQMEIEDPFLKSGGTHEFLVQAEDVKSAERFAYALFDRISDIEVQDDYTVVPETRRLTQHEIVQLPIGLAASLTEKEPACLLP